MLNTTPTQLQILWENEQKAHCAIRDAKNDRERKEAQGKWADLKKHYYDMRYNHANELLFQVNGEESIAVLYVRKHGYGIAIVKKGDSAIEHFGPYKTEENAMRYASRKYDIDFNNVIVISGYERGANDAHEMLNHDFDANGIMISLRDEVMDENGNSEDSVNVLAYEAYQRLYGETPMYEMDTEKMDALLGIAAQHVKENAMFHGIEWEEYRW